jgi:beta-N-acetylhexosaminidase
MEEGGVLGSVMIGLEGTRLSAPERELLRHPRVGGVILFTRNYESPEQLAVLTAEIHALRDPPLLIAIDQEGGRVQRLRAGFTTLPALAALGRVHDRSPAQAAALAETTGWLMAIELRCVGVDFSFAPVLDVDSGVSSVIGDRAFHRDPHVVSALAAAYVRGMRRAGMAATGKHFPGHGSVCADSHHELPVDPRDYAQIAALDLVPFARLGAQGLEAVMAAHVLYSGADERLAGFSSFWIGEVLRGRLGFRGAVFSDDLLMGAAVVAGDISERTGDALRAGCDMVLVCRGLDEAAAAAECALRVPAPAGAAQRLARMRSRGNMAFDRLRAGGDWQAAVRAVGEYAADRPGADPTAPGTLLT